MNGIDPEDSLGPTCEMSWLRKGECAHCQGHIDRQGNVIES